MKIAVVGAGLSGLTCAYTIYRLNPQAEITLFESEPTSGGKLKTVHKEGFLIEFGANGFLSNKEEMWQLIDDLDARDTVVTSSDSARKRFIFTDKLHQLPETPKAFLTTKLLPLSAKLRVLAEIITPAKYYDDELLYDFGVRRLGKKFTEVFLDAMTAGVFASTPSKLSVNAAFPMVSDLEHTYGGLFKGMIKKKKKEAGPGGLLTSFAGGVGQLIKRIDFGLETATRKYGITVDKITKTTKGWHVHYNNTFEEFDVVIMATPAFVSAPLLKEVDEELSNRLKAIEYSPAAVVALGYDETLTHPLDGFGLLTTTSARKPLLGVLWDSSIFPGRAPDGKKLLRIIIGGQRNPELAVKDTEELIALAIDGVRQTMGITVKPYLSVAERWYKAIPNYNVGHIANVNAIFSTLKKHKGLFLCSNAYHGVSMNDCVKNSKTIAQEVCLYRP